MKLLRNTLLQAQIAGWAFAAFLLSTQVGLLPVRWRLDGVLFHWQIWLLAGIFAVALRDLAAPACGCAACQASTRKGWRRLILGNLAWSHA